MAGDHKCPVCASTFTRPQHVARHMRSHTGDRPYKCVHCGDQFARSDLLSRHVNKCHASEKPPTTTQPARRKGHAQPGSSSAGGVRGPAPPLIPPPGSRKICDPCAHSRTPAQCDSGLPCGKCLQRNTRCTYVKANDIRHPAPGAASASTSVSRQHDVVPTPSVPLTVPSMAAPRIESLFPSQPDFNFTVPLYPQSLDPRSAYTASTHPHPPSLSLSATTSESVEYAEHAFDDMLSQRIQPGPPPTYTNHGQHDGQHVGQYGDGHKPVELPYLGQPFPSGDLPDFLYNAPPAQDLSQHQQHDQHLHVNGQQQQYGFDLADLYHNEPTQRGVVSSDFAHVFQPGYQQQQQHQGQDEFPALQEGGFSSAFGLMSLDDPAVAAEMSKGNSFFAPGAAAARKPAERDANIAELRDFWKAFMRDNTPGSEKTPGLGGLGAAAAGERPAMRRSLSKMASLPDIKTPPVDAGPHYSTAEEPRTHVREDLSSYEQAVLARKAPMLRPPPERPSFKRLASQTLGPFESKTVKVSHPVAAEAIAAYEGGLARFSGHPNQNHNQTQNPNPNQNQNQGRDQPHHQRQHVRSPSGEAPPVLHHAEREREGAARRLSAPTALTRPRFTAE